MSDQTPQETLETSHAGLAIWASGDGNIDGIIKSDKLGLDAVYFPAKH